MKKAFTMVELIFVIVILGILAAVAIPKMGSSKSHAEIAKGRSDVASIRSSILNERQTQLIKGINSFIPKLSDNDDLLFMGDGNGRTLLTYGIASGTSDGKWSKDKDNENVYYFHTNGKSIKFTYDKNKGTFSCDRDDDDTGTLCKKLVD
ncbi:Type II secretion envelope pseudopilin protein (PulG,guides folded protein to PulD in outer membrane) [hydrothermal vent metagenome]|uniref:Type II secretion envelope pseudopilin protein (PulG,guides folded protein to PulD in outer membrane) n=1 Tax=hydrothermal vent metagenome TaxID=652676 RepID=A0A1W1BIT8_9ZZZZ